MATLLDGKKLAEDVREALKPRIAALAARGIVPGLAVLLVGEDQIGRAHV